mmetsp:Transcript_51389/g.118078  ORF Transcript_51389/g.118078 Transcript_51389/m.118078 type:complete len:88 (+) Transcript_51389:1-264(+)
MISSQPLTKHHFPSNLPTPSASPFHAAVYERKVARLMNAHHKELVELVGKTASSVLVTPQHLPPVLTTRRLASPLVALPRRSLSSPL